MNCPDTETLIAFAMNPLADEGSELAAHIHGCAQCRENLMVVNDTLLAPEWSMPRSPVDVGDVTHPLKTARGKLAGVLSSHGGQDGQPQPAMRREEPSIDSFIHSLDKDVRDESGAWMRRGAKVLRDPEFPERVERATTENIRQFIANGFSFFRRLPFGTMSALKSAQREINMFGPAVDRNVAALQGRTIPGLNLPAWVNFIPWPFRLRFKRHVELSVERDCLAEWMAERSLLPRRDSMSPDGWAAVCDANFFRAYEVRTGSIRFRFFSVYVTPISPATRRPMAADAAVYAAMKDFISEWSRNAGNGAELARANYSCCIMGTSEGWGGVQPALHRDGIDLLCAPKCDLEHTWDVWDVRHHDLSQYRQIFRDFVHSLYPDTRESRVSRVRELVDARLMEGSLTASRMSREAHIPEDVVEHIFDALQGDGRCGYENYRTEKGESAVRKVSRSIRPKTYFKVFDSPVWQYTKGALVALSFAGQYAKRFVASDPARAWISVACASILAVTYVQSCLEGFFKRRLEK